MNRHLSSSFGTPAPYGHACIGCSQSKSKCIIRPAGGPCERCSRLNRECRPTESVRRRNRRKSVATKKARLEEKLDDLVSLIKAGDVNRTTTINTQPTTSVDNPKPHGITQTNANTRPHNEVESDLLMNNLEEHAHSIPALTTATVDGTDSSYEPSAVEAVEYLKNFQTYKTRYFPFICISSTTSAQQLRQERPFLWLCIMTVSSKSTSQQQKLSRKIRETIAQKMVVQSINDVDLLLGLLAFIGWANYQVHVKPFLAVFTQLAVSLVFDLGLAKPVPKDTQTSPCIIGKCPKRTTPRTMEERRAVLGCFLVTSIISSFLQRIDALRWTAHMDECLRILDERRECSNDKVLVEQVRLQLIVQKMVLRPLHDGTLDSAEDREHSLLYFESLRSQLQSVKTRLLNEFGDNEVVLLHLYNTELETALSPTFLHNSKLTVKERDSLYAGLESIKSWFTVFFTITPAAYIGFPFSIFSQLIRCLTTLYRLMILEDPAWDENRVWKTTDALLILDRVINSMEQVAILAGLDNSDSSEGDTFSRLAQLLQSLRPGWEARLQSDDLVSSTIPDPQNVDGYSFLDSFGMEIFDNDWLTDFILPSN